MEGLSLAAAADVARQMSRVQGFEPPSWREVLTARPPPRNQDDFKPGSQRPGWQHETSSRTEQQFKDLLFAARLSPSTKATIRSQGGPGAVMVLVTCPTCRITTIPPQLFRVTLLRRLRLPLHLAVRSCRCGLPLDEFGHHRAACDQAGVLSRRGWSLENVVASTCCEAGGRVSTNIFMRDLDLGHPDVADGRRLEVVVDGLPIFGGAQLAVDTTLVCALHRDGTPVGRAAETDGVALGVARRRKERRYNELLGRRARAKLVVLAVEVGGRWSEETRTFLSRQGQGTPQSHDVERKWRHVS